MLKTIRITQKIAEQDNGLIKFAEKWVGFKLQTIKQFQ